MSDGEMIIHLHDLARMTNSQELREIADRLNDLVELSKKSG